MSTVICDIESIERRVGKILAFIEKLESIKESRSDTDIEMSFLYLNSIILEMQYIINDWGKLLDSKDYPGTIPSTFPAVIDVLITAATHDAKVGVSYSGFLERINRGEKVGVEESAFRREEIERMLKNKPNLVELRDYYRRQYDYLSPRKESA